MIDPIQALKNVLTERKWTQKQLAAEIGMPQGTLSQVLNGNMKPGRDLLGRITKFLGVGADEAGIERTEKSSAVGVSEKSATITLTGEDDLVVIASDPAEMVGAQHATIATVARKIDLAQRDLDEARQIKAAAEMAKIDGSAAERLIKKGELRLLYLGKIKEALEAGYVPVPNFPGSALAIRVKRRGPHRQVRDLNKEWRSMPDVRSEQHPPDILPSGGGEYKNPVAPSNYVERSDPATEKITTRNVLFDPFLDEELSLPIEFMRPTLIKRLDEAMKLKIFDEILLVTGKDNVRAIDGDPMIIGRVVSRGGRGGNRQKISRLSFLIAWFFDTSEI